RKAPKHTAHLTPKETALCNAIQARYPTRVPPFDFETSNRSYAESMRKVYDEFGQEDLNIRCLFTDSLMMTAPRKMFDTHTGKPIIGTPVHEVTKLLEDALKVRECRDHPGILHLWIHH